MQGLVLGFVLGVVLLQQCTRLPPVGLSLLLPVILVAMVRYRRAIPLLALVCGVLWAALQAHARLEPSLARPLEGRDITLTGIIASIPTDRGRAQRFRFAVDRDSLQLGFMPSTLRLNWYGDSAPALRLHQRWRLTVRLKRPWGFSNPGGFDYEGWLFQRDIGATGYVRHPALARLLNPATGPPGTLGGIRQWFHKALAHKLANTDNAGVITALAVGERGAIRPDQWDLLLSTGTNHLLAISGLHIGLIAGFVYLLVLTLWRWLPALSLRWPAPRAAAVASLLAGLVYAALAGFSIPTQRAIIMLAVAVLATLADRSLRPGNVLALALLTVLIWDPLAVMSSGFWLSFSAVGIILWTVTGRQSTRTGWLRIGRLQWTLALALIPLTLWFFSRASLVAPVANLVAVPWVGFISVPATLLGTLCLPLSSWLSGLLLMIADRSLDLLWIVLHALAGLPHANWWHAPPAWTLVPGVMGLLWLLAPRGWPARAVGLVLLAPMVWAAPPRPSAGAFALTLLDVGEGLAAVVETRHHTLVYDTGARFSARFNAGEAVLVPYLQHRDITTVARLIVSHEDNDHIGGAAALLDRMPVGAISTSAPEAFHGRSPKGCMTGQHWQWDGVDFRMLHPPARWTSNSNDRSCVLRIGNQGGSALLTGDIEARVERRLRKAQPAAIDADILLVPHHGSNSSSTRAFIEAVSPQLAVVSTGYRNRYDFPRPAVLARYRGLGIPVVNTAVSGAIRLTIDPVNGIQQQPSYRLSAQRYWTTRQ